MSKREISRQLRVSRNSVKAIIKAKGSHPKKVRRDEIKLDEEMLQKVYRDCNGWVQRVHEILREEKKITIGYSTLTHKLRKMGLRSNVKLRCDSVPDSPGEEMQHDTTIYTLKVGEKKVKVIASVIYFRYSKIKYLKLYRRFNRFKMKCFFHEALTWFGYCASICIIDNTNLARLSGSGYNAVIVNEMERFAANYGFRFRCHAIGHANRKAGNERAFWTTESNFLPGRTFESMEDLNRQAFEWATDRQFYRKTGKPGIIPAKMFEYEKPYLKALPAFVQAPYNEHQRKTDQYGYAAFAANYYWIPGSGREEVTLLEFDHHLEIYLCRALLVKYELPPEGVKNQTYTSEDSTQPKRRPNNRKKPTAPEEKKLRALSQSVDDWLTKTLKKKGIGRHHLIRSLYQLHLKMGVPLFLRTIERANSYGITDLYTLESIASHLLKNESYVMPDPDLHEEFKSRKSYLDGFSSDDADLSQFDELLSRDKTK